MERYVYLSYVEVDYEGSNLAGIHLTLEEAKAKAEALQYEATHRYFNRNEADVPDAYAQGLSFHVHLFDTEKQEVVYSWSFEQEEKVWRSAAYYQISSTIEQFKHDQEKRHAR